MARRLVLAATAVALAALVERELERAWLDAHPDDDLPGEVPVDLSNVPWDES